MLAVRTRGIWKKTLAILVCASLVLGLNPGAALAANTDQQKAPEKSLATTDARANATATVSYTTQMDDAFTVSPQIGVTVRGDLAESYGYEDEVTDGVSVLDVLVDAHIKMFGESFTPETATGLLSLTGGSPSICFGTSSEERYSGFAYNDSYPGGATGSTVASQSVQNGDTISFFFYGSSWNDYLAWFCQNDAYVSSITSNGIDPIELTVKGQSYMAGWMYNDAAAFRASGESIPSARLAWVNRENGTKTDCAIAAENGNVSITPPTDDGTYYLTAYYTSDDANRAGYPLIMPLLPVTIQKQTVSTATVSYSAQMYNDMFTLMPPQIDVEVRSDTAEQYGYKDNVANGVSALDVLVSAHENVFGDDVNANLSVNNGWVSLMFGDSSSFGFAYNDSYPYGGEYGSTVDTQQVYDGDTLVFFNYQDTVDYTDRLTWFCENGVYTSSIKSNMSDPIELSLKGCQFMSGYSYGNAVSLHGMGKAISSASVGWLDLENNEITSCVTTAIDGSLSIAPPKAEGIYYLTAFLDDIDVTYANPPIIRPLLQVVVDASYVPPAKNPSALSSLEVADWGLFMKDGVLNLNPIFDSNIYEYTSSEVAYTDSVVDRSLALHINKCSPDAIAAATLNSEPLEDANNNLNNGGWTQFMMDKGLKPGKNTLVVTVTNGDSITTYTVNIPMFDPNAPVEPEPLEPVPPAEDIAKLTNAATSYLASTVTNPTFSSLGGEWAVIGQMRGESANASNYATTYAKNLAAELARTNGVLSKNTYTDYSRAVLALTAAGYDVTDFAGYNLLQPLADSAAVSKQGINGPIWALIALDSHAYEIPAVADANKAQTTREGLIETIVNAQLEDGGWAIAGKSLDVDTTAMALIALAPYTDKTAAQMSTQEVETTEFSTQEAVNTSASTAVEKALVGLENYFTNDANAMAIANMGPDSYAQLITALIACGVNPATDTRFGIEGVSPVGKLISFANEDGAFSRTVGGAADLRATEQSLLSLVAYKRFVENKNTLYNMSDVAIDKHQAPITPEQPTEPTNPQQPLQPANPQQPQQPQQPVNNATQNNSASTNTSQPEANTQLPGNTPTLFGGNTATLPSLSPTNPESTATEQQATDSVAEQQETTIANSETPLALAGKALEKEPATPFTLGIVLIIVGVAGAICIGCVAYLKRKRS